MNVDVESLDKVRKKVQVLLPEEQLLELRESIYEELRKKAKIKGFRPGKVPKSIITTYYSTILRKNYYEYSYHGRSSNHKMLLFEEPLSRFDYKHEGEPNAMIPDNELSHHKGKR